MEEMQTILEDITKIKQAARSQGKKANEVQLQQLRDKFKNVAMEVFKEMYGFYNTEPNDGPGGILGDLLGGEPLTAQEKRLLEKQLNEQMDNTLALMENLTSMNESELNEQLQSLLGGSGIEDFLSDEELADWMQQMNGNGDGMGSDDFDYDDLLGSLSSLLN